jgi:hypothetical protein
MNASTHPTGSELRKQSLRSGRAHAQVPSTVRGEGHVEVDLDLVPEPEGAEERRVGPDSPSALDDTRPTKDSVVGHTALDRDRPGDGWMLGGVEDLLWRLRRHFPTIRLVWADAGYAGKLVTRARQVLALTVQIVRKRHGRYTSRSCPAAGLWNEPSPGWASAAGWPSTMNASPNTTRRGCSGRWCA